MPPLPDARLVNCHRQLHEAACRCYALRTRIAELAARLTPAQLTAASFVLLVLLVLVLLSAGYGIDVLLMRSISGFLVSLAAANMEHVAHFLVPAFILGLEVFVSTSSAREREGIAPRNDAFAIYDTRPKHQETIWRVLGGFLLALQLVSALATYLALEQSGPGFSAQNQLLCCFLILSGLSVHVAVLLFSGRYLTALASAIEQRSITTNLRKTRVAYVAACQGLLRGYQDYRILQNQHPDAKLELIPLAAAEIQHALSLGQPAAQQPSQPELPVSPPTSPHDPTPGPVPSGSGHGAAPTGPPAGLPDPPNPYAPADDGWGDDQRL